VEEPRDAMTIADYMAVTVLVISGLVAWFFPGVIMEWQRIATAPFDRDLELAVINYDGLHALAFPCRRVLGSWSKAETKQRIDVRPTHWREWSDTR
jgi:hypothetical protein